MESLIVELLDEKNKVLKLEEIVRELNEDVDKVIKALKVLEEDGIVFRNKKGKYTLVANTTLKKGIIKITKRRGAIVVLSDKTEYPTTYKDYKQLQNNDIVLVDMQNGVKVVKILKRKHHDYIGEVVKEGKYYKVVAEGHESIILDKVYPIGTRVLIDGTSNEIKEVIGYKDDVGTREREILLLNNFPISYSPEYLEELKEIPSSISDDDIDRYKKMGIKDLRGIPLYTVDGSDTKDFDDAVGVYNNDIYISIANVTFFIKENGYIWEDMLKRGISVYPPGMVNPMLHHYISNGICSLIPGEDRLAITLVIKLDDDGKVISYKVIPSIINSRKRMTYEEVNSYLEDNNIILGYEDYTESLEYLFDVASKIKDNMIENGFLDFSSNEVKIILDNMKTKSIKKRYQGKAEDLIEFLMILHNLTMTDYFIKHKLPFIARNHGTPNGNKLASWNHLLRMRGYDAKKISSGTSSEISSRLGLYRDSKERVILDSYAIKSQAKARYGAYNIGHFAIGVDAYATFSSPIRRCDVINQKVLTDALEYGYEYARGKWSILLPRLADNATDAEKRADMVERVITDIRKAQYMERYIGYEYDALVLEVNSEYIKVLLPNMVEGKIFISKYEYVLSKDGFSLYSNSTNERILVGDSIRVKVVKCDTYNGLVIMNRESYRDVINDKKRVKKK